MTGPFFENSPVLRRLDSGIMNEASKKAINKMRIVIPVIGFAPSGGYRVLSKLADEWLKAGHSVSFISTEWSIPPYFKTNAEVIWVNDAGDVVRAPRGQHLNGAKGLFRILKSLYRGLKKHAGTADILIANQNLTVWPVALYRTRAKKIYYVQAYEPEYYHSPRIQSRILKLVSFLTYHAIDEKIVNSPIYLNYKNLRAKRIVAPGVDFNVFYPASQRIKQENTWIIGCVGRKEPEKGTKYVVEAFERLTALGLPVILRVAYGNIPADVASRKDCQVIVPKDDSGLADFYRGLDIMIAPGTLQLGAPHYPVMEAMACGIPVITTGYTPANESNAWIVPVADSEAIANAAQAIIGLDENTRNEKIGRATAAISSYSWPAVAATFLSHIEQIKQKADS